eukprot:3905501-Alexandrium_andersonii.AAC.1
MGEVERQWLFVPWCPAQARLSLPPLVGDSFVVTKPVECLPSGVLADGQDSCPRGRPVSDFGIKLLTYNPMTIAGKADADVEDSAGDVMASGKVHLLAHGLLGLGVTFAGIQESRCQGPDIHSI